MKEIKRILVGIDIFAKSNNVLKRAITVARENNATLFVVYAVDTPWLSIPSYFGSEDVQVDLKGIKKKIEKKIQVLNNKDEVPYIIIIKEGSPHDILSYEAKLLKVDMMIIGANTTGKKNVLGSTAEKMVHRSRLPVLIVKNAVKDTYKNIVAPTDFQTQSKQSILLAKILFKSATIKPVHSFETIYLEGPYTTMGQDMTPYNEAAKVCAKRDIKKLTKNLSIEKGKVLDGTLNNKKALVSYINKGTFDLTVIGSAGLHAHLGSMASSIIRDSKTDVLVFVP
ncbi:MAG: Unknown protein [uncultured Sulfurovum sp.]|uniref:UspA domain-containing protein n=1 Tax=uncultured Sulfurovum sp. TaxID=269237 RepID=A0A6S6SFL4_9BACT|nr:MAG: Unknown protein [uncultured Sulfurovum sp.]